jgi:hypothetical protein
VPSAPTAIGRPDQVFVPVMPAAMMLPTAMLIEAPMLPETWAANNVPINLPRVHAEPGAVARVFIGTQCRVGQSAR